MARILIVEDDRALRHDLSGMLSDWGHTVLEASDGQKGFSVIEQFRPDLVLSDIKMPGENGFELVRRVTEAGSKYANMPFIFISAMSARDVPQFGHHGGADDFITKPINPRVLKAKIELILRKKSSPWAKFLAFFGFRLALTAPPRA